MFFIFFRLLFRGNQCYSFIVSDPPKVTVKMESESENPIIEGSSVKLKCDISARPSATSFSWYFNVSVS